MGVGFEVDLYALRQAADGIARITDAVAARPVDAVETTTAVLGHERLTGAAKEFLERWQRGVEDLCADGRQIAGRLRESADVYLRSDEHGRRTFDGVRRVETGPDPAALP